MATKKQTATQKAKEQADESLKKLASTLKSAAEHQQLQHRYEELKQDYLELALSVQNTASNSARIMQRHNINREAVLSFGEGAKTNA